MTSIGNVESFNNDLATTGSLNVVMKCLLVIFYFANQNNNKLLTMTLITGMMLTITNK